MESVISAVVGLIGITVGSLLSPWLSQRIEVQRAKSLARRKLIDDAREYVAGKQFGVANFSAKPFYLSLQSLLPTDLVEEIESFRGSEKEDPVEARERIRKKALLSLACIEKSWRLI